MATVNDQLVKYSTMNLFLMPVNHFKLTICSS